MSLRLLSIAALLALLALAAPAGETAPPAAGPYSRWNHGPSKDASWFPIAVWLQNPDNAQAFKKAGINLYVGLWKGPTEAQLAKLRQSGMPVICSQNAVGLAHENDSIIVGWMDADEPDNAQPLPEGKGYGPPVEPAGVIERYNAMRAADPSRPVLLNLGSGAAVDALMSRGTRSGHPEDYPEYLKGCDIASYAIYPAGSGDPKIKGNLSLVARGAERLVAWSGGKPVWTCIECTRGSAGKPSPRQVKAEVWMSLIRGSAGIVYFVHEFNPRFREAALLEDRDMLAAVTAINREVAALALALNSPSIDGILTVESTGDAPIAATAKKAGGATYVFAVAMKPGAAQAAFTLRGLPQTAEVEILGENRTLPALDGRFKDSFADWAVHLYKVK